MSRGRYGKHGGQYVPETLMNEIIRLEEAYEHYKNDPEFVQELDTLLKEYIRKQGAYMKAGLRKFSLRKKYMKYQQSLKRME